MAWRLTARKGKMRQRSGSSRKDLIQARAKRLRRAGYTVSIYRTKGR